jgi:predicted deacylase
MQQPVVPSQARRSRVATDVVFDRDGKHCGFLSLPISTHESAYGRIQIPIVVVRNGEGPTALLVAGNHGDEYEGQIALTRLAQDLRPEAIRGRVILLPALNLPAVRAGRRTSPMDEGNLNRTFPGDPEGGPTAAIAHYVESTLLPLADFALDLHSGGSSLVYLPCALVRDGGSPERVARTFAALDAFGAPLAYVTDGRNQGAERTFHAAADRCGVIAITTELGGAAGIDRAGLGLAEAGIRRLLRHAGILRDEALVAASAATRLMMVEGPAAYVLAPEDGVFEPLFPLGAEVQAGDLAGHIHAPDTPWRASVPVRFGTSGFVICQRAPAATRRGDCLYQVLAPYTGPGAA